MLARALFIITLAGALIQTERAYACETNGDCMVTLAGFATAGTLDMGLTAYAVASARQGKPVSRAVALTEILVTIPQLVIASSVMADQGMDAVLMGVTGWTAAIAVHGIWSLATHRSTGPAEQFRPDSDVTFAPSVISDGAELGAGLTAVGRF